MISEYMKSDSSKILYVINDAAIKYKGIIPDNCWHEPYMSERELVDEFKDGVRMFGYNRNNKLVGVIGIQEIKRCYPNKTRLYFNSLPRQGGRRSIT